MSYIQIIDRLYHSLLFLSFSFSISLSPFSFSLFPSSFSPSLSLFLSFFLFRFSTEITSADCSSEHDLTLATRPWIPVDSPTA